MATLIDLNQEIEDKWIHLGTDAPAVEQQHFIVASKEFERCWSELDNYPAIFGLELQTSDEVEEFIPYLHRLGIILLNFPSFADGRGFSQARLLRERFGYRGDIRAVGDVQRDQLAFMRRCGINQFLLKDGESPQQALKAFAEIEHQYQAGVRFPLAS